MTSETQYREGDDLDELLARLDAQHPGQVRVSSISYPREGGVLGFFARQRVGVHFTLDGAAQPPAVPQAAAAPAPATRAAPLSENAQFAQLLLELARSKAADAGPAPAPAPAPAERTGRELELRRRLTEVGVPVERVPSDVDDAYRAVAHLVAALPETPWPPVGHGQILAVAGDGSSARAAADELAARMHLPANRVYLANSADRAGEASVGDVWQAAALAAEVRAEAAAAAIVVLATDDRPDGSGCGEWEQAMLAAIVPDALWALVDATRKPADTRAQLARFGSAPTALVVTGATRTASPATVWELGIPVATLDGRPATRGTWAALLIDALDAQEG